MKVSNFLFLFLLAGVLFACSKSSNEAIQEEIGIRSVVVSLNGFNSEIPKKSVAVPSAPVDVFTPSTKDVNSVLINLTDASDNVIVSKLITKDNVLNSDWYKLITPGQGLKFINTSQAVSKVYVYGNPKTAVGNTNIINTTLADQQGSEVLYYGLDDNLIIDTEPINPDPTVGQTSKAEVTIVPIVARLQIKSISFAQDSSFTYSRQINNQAETATVTWNAFSGNLKGIYLNNVYYGYKKPGTVEGMLSNLTFASNIQSGQWLFTAPSPVMNAAVFASYSNYDGTSYQNLPLSEAGKCYAFNFFPGTEIPALHLDLSDLVIENLASTNEEVFNPALQNSFRFANIMKFYKNVNTPMVASDFKPGTLYNMHIRLIPALDSDLKNMQYNVMVLVTIADWEEETITPGFDLQN